MLRASNQKRLLTPDMDPLKTFKDSLRGQAPWDSIVDFATHPSFCGKHLFPRQLTLLKLVYLEEENLTDYDHEVIGEWTEGFWKNDPEGVQPDILERVRWLKARGYKWFPHIQMVMGRRASKGVVGGIIGAHQVAYMHSLDDWPSHFGLDPNANAYAVVVAVNQTQASRTLFNDMRGSIVGCKYLESAIATPREDHLTLRTPADLRKIADMEYRKIPLEREIASLQTLAASSNSASIRGLNMFFIALDEMAFMLSGTGGVRTSEELYHALKPSLTQFKKEQMLYLPSSPYSQVGIFYDLYVQGRAQIPTDKGDLVEITESDVDFKPEAELKKVLADPRKLVFQLPSWGLYKDYEKAHTIPVSSKQGAPFIQVFDKPPPIFPPEEDESIAMEEAANPSKFRVERRGQFAATEDAYLPEILVERMFEPVEWRDEPVLSKQDWGKLTYVYRIHCDPSRVNANFAMAIAHLEEAPADPETGMIWPHVIIDHLKVWKPTDFKDGIIDYTKIDEELDYTLNQFPSTSAMTFDQYQSAGSITRLGQKHGPRIRVYEVTFTKQYNQDRFERFKTAMGLGWVHSYRDNYFGPDNDKSLLEHELKFLQEVNGKVEKQEIGPVTTKDLADCVMVVTTDLLHEHLDLWKHKMLGNMAFGSSDVGALRSATGREQYRLGAVTDKLGRSLGAPGSLRDLLARQAIERQRVRRTGEPEAGRHRGGR